jgi:Tfp pilus assembly protein FimT
MKQVISADGLISDDFNASGLNEAVAASVRRHNSDDLVAIGGRLRAAQEAGDDKSVAVCRLLSVALMLSHPWTPRHAGGTSSPGTADAEDSPPTFELDDSAYTYLGQVLPLIQEPDVRARVADLLWNRDTGKGKKDFKAGMAAVPAYLEAASLFETPRGHWPHAHVRVARACDIATRLNNRDLKHQVVEHIEKVLTEHTPVAPSADGAERTDGPQEINEAASKPSLYPAKLMRLLHHYGAADAQKHGDLAVSLAKQSASAGEPRFSREYLEVAALLRRPQAEGEAVALRAQAAEVLVSEAENFVRTMDFKPLAFLMGARKIEEAIQELRTLAGAATVAGDVAGGERLARRVEALRRLHVNYEKQGVGATVTVRHSADATDVVAKVLTVVEGRTKTEGLLAFACLPAAVPEDYVRRGEMEERQTYLFLPFFETILTNAQGRTVARRSGSSALPSSASGATEEAGIPPDDDPNVRMRMFERARMLCHGMSQVFVSSLRERLSRDHAFTSRDFALIARASPFVPVGREFLFARGLHAGMHGDFAVAASLLVPQVEYALAFMVSAAHHEPDSAGNAGTGGAAGDISLNTALRDPDQSTVLAAALGSRGNDLVFTLRMILVERFGANLRPRVAHGLMSYDEFFDDAISPYFWWLTLHLCCLTIQTMRPPVSGEPDANQEADEQAPEANGGTE